MKNILKSTVKFATGMCVALGAVAVTASVVPDSKVAKVVTAGVKAAKDAMKEELEALKGGTVSATTTESFRMTDEESAMFADVEETAKESAEN